jgi:ankyrin repeat protein
MWASGETLPPPSSPSPEGSTDLGPDFRAACWNGNLPEVQRLLAAGAPLEDRDKYLRTPLFLACHNGNAEVVKFLLDHGARADVVNDHEDTTIGQACEFGHLEAAKLILVAGAGINHANRWGRTPLMLASREGRDDVVAWLISRHVDVTYHATDLPALYYAILQNHYLIAQMLVKAGAKAGEAPESVAGVEHPFGYTMLAAQTDDPRMIELVLGHGARVDERDAWGRTPLMRACAENKLHSVTCLLNRRADVNAADEDGLTSLMFSVEDTSVDQTRLLIQRGARVGTRDKQGKTALHHAAQYLRDLQAQALVDLGADTNATDAQGLTALEYAGDRGDMNLVAYLEKKGATRSDVRIISRPLPNPALTPAQSWALAVGAIYAQYNGENPHALGHGGFTNMHGFAYDPGEAKKELKDDWKIADRAGLLQRLEALLAEGNRQMLQKWGARFASMSDAEFADLILKHSTDPQMDQAQKAARSSYLKWKDRSGLAWDLCRRANMICNGHAAGYISGDEAWPLQLENARRAQAAFTSWQEMGDNFLDGREAGDGVRDPRFEACTRLLQNTKGPNSVWNQLPWDTDLSK